MPPAAGPRRIDVELLSGGPECLRAPVGQGGGGSGEHDRRAARLGAGIAPSAGCQFPDVFVRVSSQPGHDIAQVPLRVWSKNSCGLSVIEFQEAAEALASLYIPRYFTDPILGRWKQDHVALALVISFRVEVIHVILKAVAERAFSEKNHFRQELVLYGSNPVLRHQILVAQEELLINRTGDVRQQSFPIHRRDLTEPTACEQSPHRPVNR